VGLLFAYASSPAWAALRTVNSLADDADGTDGECTLREAITSANTDTASGTATGECAAGSGDDEIHFALPGTAPWTVNLTGAMPTLDSDLTIAGPGADQFTVRRDTGGDYRIFLVSSGTQVSISGMTISGGNVPLGTDGGGILNNGGTLTITSSTISDNSAPTGTGSGTASFGSALTRTEVPSTIISANLGSDVDAGQPNNTFVSKGYNLIGTGNATGAFNQTGDQTGVTDPKLGALSDNGGPTQTHALLSGSPAINAIPQGTNGCGTTFTEDQRGVSRPQGSACDIGSFELESPTSPDTEAPRVISTFPRNGGELGPAANIRATFSEDMREASVINAFKLFRKGSTNQIAARVSYDAATDIATLNPTNNLRKRAIYKAVVSTQAKDVAGNRLDQDGTKSGLQQKVWFFEIDD
jgi:CSLREA domain-containing protein